MKYVFKTDLGYYKFSRKIPNSKKLFSFSLKTQNLKVAKKITNSFLLKSHDYFLFIQDLTKEDVVNQFNEIVAALNEYKKAALVEYSKLEQDRHTHFTYEGADGSHPEAIKYWLSEMQEHISARKTERQTLEFGRRILSRATTELKTFYGNITKEQKLFFLQTLIKTEAKLLQVDNKRANDYFGADYMLQQQAPTDSVGGGIEEVLKKVLDERLGTKTIQFISKEDVVQKFKESAPVVKRYKRESYMFDHSLNILLGCSAKEALNEYDNEDYDNFFQAFLFFPAGITKKSVFSKTFESDYVKISKYFKHYYFETNEETADFVHVKADENFVYDTCLSENELVIKEYEQVNVQSETTLFNKLTIISNFFKFCVDNNYLEKNPLTTEREYFWKEQIKEIGESVQSRYAFTQEEIQLMLRIFIEENFFINENIAHFWIPIIAMFQGMRLEEICKLRKNDIVLHKGHYCFDINGYVKTSDSVRIIPIHTYLIKNLKFINYVESREDYLFDLQKVKINGIDKFSKKYSGIFGEFRTKFVTEERIEKQLISFHSFRHFFAQTLYENDVKELSDISVLLGHKMTSSETGTYLKGDIARKSRNLEKLKFNTLKTELDILTMKFSKIKFSKNK